MRNFLDEYQHIVNFLTNILPRFKIECLLHYMYSLAVIFHNLGYS